VVREFFARHLFGPDRKPCSANDSPRRPPRTPPAARKRPSGCTRLKKIGAAENAHAREIENLAALP
jgi:hypothetical protein